MIDAVCNSVTGPAIVHDEKDLEGAIALLVDDLGRCAIQRRDGSLRSLSRVLDPDIHASMSAHGSCPIIRMAGRKVVSLGRIDLPARG